MPDIGELRRSVVDPVVSHMFDDDEVSQVDVYWSPGAAAGHGSILVRIVACDEVYVGYLWDSSWERVSGKALARKLASEVQDFISESSFGWGELRPVPPAALS